VNYIFRGYWIISSLKTVRVRVRVRVRVALRLAVHRQSVRLGAKLLEAHDRRSFLQLNPWGHSPYVATSLTRRWVCLLGICLPFAKCTYRTCSMIIENAFSSREAVSPIKVIIWNEESLLGVEMCLWEQSHVYMQVLQLFAELMASPPYTTRIKYYDFERPMNSSSHSVLLS
jgi:hypothetical protein